MTDNTAAWPWSVPLAAQDVPAEGRRHHLVADAPTRAAIAKMAGLSDVYRLEADIETAPHRSNGLHLTGQVSATVGQTCGVTLEPMQSEIDEAIDILYLRDPPDGWGKSGSPEEDSGTIGDERIEILAGGTVDLGVIATEFLILGINPYPRRAEAVFAPPAGDESALSPFAALSALRKSPGKSGG